MPCTHIFLKKVTKYLCFSFFYNIFGIIINKINYLQMGNIDDYNELLDAIKAVKDEDAIAPRIPAGIMFQECEDLYHWAKHDLLELTKYNFKPEMLELLLKQTGATREAQSRWMQDANTKEDAQVEWNKVEGEAYAFRKELEDICTYAYRNEEEPLSVLAKIKEGAGDADMIQDLNDLAVLGKNNPEPLMAINVGMGMFNKAADLSDYLAELRAKANGEHFSQSESKLIRDKAHTLLKETLDEIRACGRFVFRNDDSRRKGYFSRYIRLQNTKRRKDSKDNETED